MARKIQLEPQPLLLEEVQHPLVDLGGLPRNGHIPVLALAFALGLSLFLAVPAGSGWILLGIVALVGLGADGVVRHHPRAHFKEIGDTSPYLFVPVLFALASGLFLKEVVEGYWTVPAIVVSGSLMAVALYAEYASVDLGNASYPASRFALNIMTYVCAFAFYAVVYSFDVALLPSAFIVGLVSLLLAIELFHEAEADPYRSMLFAASIGWILAEMRWSLHFIPLEGFLAGASLLLAFYLATGLIQHYLTGHLNKQIALEFLSVTGIGLLIIVVGRALSIG